MFDNDRSNCVTLYLIINCIVCVRSYIDGYNFFDSAGFMCLSFCGLLLVGLVFCVFPRRVSVFRSRRCKLLWSYWPVLVVGFSLRPFLNLVNNKDLFAELNVERYELSKIGKLLFNPPMGTHDDRLWALALTVYAAENTVPLTKPMAKQFDIELSPIFSLVRIL